MIDMSKLDMVSSHPSNHLAVNRTTQAQASSPSQESVKTLGPWAVLDSKRLGHSRLQALSMTCAAAGPTEAQPLKLEMQLTWLSDNKFDVSLEISSKIKNLSSFY